MKFSADRPAPCLGLTLALALACQPDSSDTDSDTTTAGTTDTDTDGAPTTTETTGPAVDEPTPCEGEAVVLEAGVIAEPSSGEPSDIALSLSNEAITCENPTPESLQCAPNWSVNILITADIQTPGLYRLQDLASLGISGQESCDGATGGNIRGTLEILAIDATEIRGRLCHLEGQWVEDNPMVGTDIGFVAPICAL